MYSEITTTVNTTEGEREREREREREDIGLPFDRPIEISTFKKPLSNDFGITLPVISPLILHSPLSPLREPQPSYVTP